MVWDLTDLSKTGKIKVSAIQSLKSMTDFGISIAPNPVSDILWVTFKENNMDSNISIYSLNGTLMFSQEVGGSRIAIPTSSYSPGLYMVKISTPNNTVISQIIKK